MNGFNRFDPKYISIGPKALRESAYATTNINKCATLRHGGRYGGSLTDRGTNPVLKKASPPSVATVSKETHLSDTAVENELNNNSNNNNSSSNANNSSTISNNINNNSNLNNTNFNNNNSTNVTAYTGSNALIGVSSGDVVSGYETDTGVNFPSYKRSDQQRFNTMKYDDMKTNNRVLQPSTVYSIDASYHTLSRATQHAKSHQSPATINQYQYSKQVQTQPPLPVKQLPPPSSTGMSNISIINQPLPDIPQTSHSQRNSQPLSASNLEHYRSKSMGRGETYDPNVVQKFSHNTSRNREIRTVQPKPIAQAPIKNVMPPAQKVDQPPMLPPKNKNKDQHSMKSTMKQSQIQNQKQHQIHAGVSTTPKVAKPIPTEHHRYPSSDQHQHQTVYSTFGYDHSRDNRRYVRESSREMASKNAYAREYHNEPSKSSSRQHTTPHKSREHMHGMVDSHKMSDCQYPEPSSRHYNQNLEHTAPYSHRRVPDESHSYRTMESNRRNYNINRGDSTDLTGKEFSENNLTMQYHLFYA